MSPDASLQSIEGTEDFSTETHSSAEEEPLEPYYAGIFLIASSQHRLLARVPPRHAVVYAHHVTLAFRPDLDACLSLPLGAEVAVAVVGSACDERTQAIEVKLPSWLPCATPAVPHVTVSIVPEASAREAGELIAAARMERAGVQPVQGLRVVHGIVGVCLTDRTVVLSREELHVALGLDRSSQMGEGMGTVNGHWEDAGTAGRDRREAAASAADSSALAHESEELRGLMDELHSMHSRACAAEEANDAIDLAALMRSALPPVPPSAAAAPGNHCSSGRLQEHSGDEGVTQPAESRDLRRRKYAGEAAVYADEEVEYDSDALGEMNFDTVPYFDSVASDDDGGAAAAWPTTMPQRLKSGRASRAHARASKKATAKHMAAVKAWWRSGTTKAEAPRAAADALDLGDADQKQAHRLACFDAQVAVAVAKAAESFSRLSVEDVDAAVGASASAEHEEVRAHQAAKEASAAAAAAAYAAGDSSSARQLSSAAKAHKAAASAARRRASASSFHANNAEILNTFKVDLHGLSVEDAIIVLDRHLKLLGRLQHPGGVLLRVVTGVGKHSSEGKAKILPAVVQHLAEGGHLFDTEECNPGVVRVLLDPLIGSLLK